MTVYWFVWISVLMLSAFVESADFECDGLLTERQRFHTPNARFFYVLACLILIGFAGCRYYVGADFNVYYQYNQYVDFWESLQSFDEPGIRLIYVIASHIHANGQFCIFSVAAISLFMELRVIYHNTDSIGIALPIFTFMCWHACFNGVRQVLAIGVLFCGFPALRDGKYGKYIFFVILAFLCHRSAIVMVLAGLVVHLKVSPRNILLLVVISVIILLSYERVFQAVNIIMDHDLIGTEAYWSTHVNRLRPLSRLVPAVFFLARYSKEEINEIKSFYLNILMLDAVVAITGMNSAAFSRMSMYTAPFSVISIAELVKVFPLDTQHILNKVIILLYWIFAYFECQGVLFTFNRLHWFW